MSDMQPTLDERISEIGRMLTASMPSIAALQTYTYQQAVEADLQAVINAYSEPLTDIDFERFNNPTEQDIINQVLAKRTIKVGK